MICGLIECNRMKKSAVKVDFHHEQLFMMNDVNIEHSNQKYGDIFGMCWVPLSFLSYSKGFETNSGILRFNH